MKKIVPVLAVVGSALAFIAYKMKKEEQKQLMDLDEGLLKDEESDNIEEQPIVHDPIQTEPKEQPQNDSTVTEPKEETVEESVPVQEECKAEEPVMGQNGEDVYSDQYPHLTNRMVEDINTMTKEAIDALAKDGDVHEHERPVQHMVSFHNQGDLEGFKNTVINKGFVITKGEQDLDLVVLHISAIDETKLVNHILYLADQAYAFHGEYRGWQSKVSF